MSGDPAEVSRRGFLELTGAAGIAALGGGTEQLSQDEAADFEAYGLLLGPAAARPPKGGSYLSTWDTYRFVYFASDTGEKYHTTHEDAEWNDIAMAHPTTQVDEVRTENYQSFFNHTFARPEAPDTKNWDFTDADITKQASEIELASTTELTTTQRGNYPAGSEAVPGIAMRVTSTPTGGDGRGGYFTANNGLGVGEDSTDSFVFIRKGGTEKLVYRSDWNGYVPDGRVWTSERPVVTRFPHLFYGGGALEIRAIIHEDDDSELKTLHSFTPENVDDTFSEGPPIDQPNLPVTFASNSLTGGSVRANASHYEFGEVETEQRVNGEHFTQVSVGTSGWTPLLIYQKRSGWEPVNVKPERVSVIASGADVKLGLQLNPTLSSVSTSLPTNSSSSETAVEIVSATFDATGERRWAGYAESGGGNKVGGASSQQLDFNVPANQPVALVAQAVGSSADVSGVATWEEYF